MALKNEKSGNAMKEVCIYTHYSVERSRERTTKNSRKRERENAATAGKRKGKTIPVYTYILIHMHNIANCPKKEDKREPE